MTKRAWRDPQGPAAASDDRDTRHGRPCHKVPDARDRQEQIVQVARGDQGEYIMAEVQETPEGLALPVTLHTRGGLHARPAARLAQEAQHFSSDIQIQSDNGTADAKSMLDILSLAISTGGTLTLLARGDDAREALTALAEYLENLQD